MFKKKYLAVAGLMALAVVISGCGKKNSGDSVVQATPTPTQETAVTATPTPELINMEETVEKNVMGEKTSTASKVTIVNKTGSEVAAIYVRETPSDDSEDDEWGDDLVNGMFTLKNGENAVYYYEKGSSSVTYDIRITYSDEEKNECFFRKLPLTTMKQITLRMDGSGDDSIPYATYLTASSTKEVSTLNDVKKRLGLSTDDSDSDSSATPTPTDSSDDSKNGGSCRNCIRRCQYFFLLCKRKRCVQLPGTCPGGAESCVNLRKKFSLLLMMNCLESMKQNKIASIRFLKCR